MKQFSGQMFNLRLTRRTRRIGGTLTCINPKCRRDLDPDWPFCPFCGKKQAKPKQKTKSRGNGLGSVYKRGDKWLAVKTVGWITDPLPKDAPPDQEPHKRRQTVTRSYNTRKDAVAALPFLTAADRKPRQGTATQRKGTSVTLKELYDQWEPTHQKSRSTMNCYRSGFRLFAPLWNTRMEDLDVDDLQDCMDDAATGRRTLENAKAALGLVYKYGIHRHAVPKDRNLAQFLRINEPGTGSQKPGFSPEQLEKIRAEAEKGDPVAARVLCHCYLGFRPSALLALKTGDYNEKEKAFTGGIKTEAGIGRTVTVSPKVQIYVSRLVTEAGEDGFVFGKEAGKPLSLPEYRELFYELLDCLDIPNPVDDQGRHRITPHSCRHTFATLMKSAAGSDTDKLALIGHTSTEQLREYQDVRFADLRAITDQL